MTKLVYCILLPFLSLHFIVCAADNFLPQKPDLNIEKRLKNRLIKVVLEPFRQTIISSEVEGKILSIPHKLGDAVDEEVLLVKLDDRRAKATYEKSLVELEHLEQASEAIEKLYNFGDESRINLFQVQSNVKVKKIETEYAKFNLESTAIVSPFAGQIAELMVEEYENVEKSQPLLKLIDTSKSKGKALLPYSLIGKISLGQQVTIQLKEIAQSVNGTISHIAPYIDPTSGTVKIVIEVNDSTVRPGTIGYLLIE